MAFPSASFWSNVSLMTAVNGSFIWGPAAAVMRVLTPLRQDSAFWALASGLERRSAAASRVAVRIGPSACVGLERKQCTQMVVGWGLPIGCKNKRGVLPQGQNDNKRQKDNS